MKRSKQIALILLTCAFIAAVVALIWPGKPEPIYHGRSMREWKDIYKNWFFQDPALATASDAAMSREALEAVREMHDSIVPVALKDIQCETSSWRRQMAEELRQSRYLSRWCPTGISTFLNENQVLDGAIYFHMLGPEASAAVPDLVCLMNRAKLSQTSKHAMYALGEIGQDGLKPLMKALADPAFPNHQEIVRAIVIGVEKGADPSPFVPLLVKSLTNSDEEVFKTASEVLGYLAMESDIVVPALTNCLKNIDQDRRAEGILALQEFGAKARPAIPFLKMAMDDENELVRYRATNALKKIAPEILGTNISAAP